jgi:hypothetical protein
MLAAECVAHNNSASEVEPSQSDSDHQANSGARVQRSPLDAHIPVGFRVQWMPAVTVLVCRHGQLPAGLTTKMAGSHGDDDLLKRDHCRQPNKATRQTGGTS